MSSLRVEFLRAMEWVQQKMLKRMLELEEERKRVQREKRAQWHQEELKGSLGEKILRCMAEAEKMDEILRVQY